ncbi:hypothetical protein BESB_073300 [Besnoitia besnoiti]|uniref:Transmembrane protein n=1 Tax=Besnoitia besnoiti TaxID=94643 RepID=A0A2A9M6S8_BESBE|nr:uncharacterized protein BESB_073300 [Besnoitia besnoiti]PFH34178.1 hypothetical protein BESB_073300 [Besnoitia besnoiti]
MTVRLRRTLRSSRSSAPLSGQPLGQHMSRCVSFKSQCLLPSYVYLRRCSHPQTIIFVTLVVSPLLVAFFLPESASYLGAGASPTRSRFRQSTGRLESSLFSERFGRAFIERSGSSESARDNLTPPGDVAETTPLTDEGADAGSLFSSLQGDRRSAILLHAPILLIASVLHADADNTEAQVGVGPRAPSRRSVMKSHIALDPTASGRILMSEEIARVAAEGLTRRKGITFSAASVESLTGGAAVVDAEPESVVRQVEERVKTSIAVEKEAPLSEAAEGSPCTKAAVEARLKEIGCPLQLSNRHFALDYKFGVRIKGREFKEEKASKFAYLPRAVSEAPSYEPLPGLVLLADIDEPGIGSDVRLLHIVVRPSVCEEKGAKRCTIPYLLPPVPLAEPAHRILALGFDSPTGKTFKITEVLKLIQEKPLDLDLRRISLSRLIEDNHEFFQVKKGMIASPSWNVFKVYNVGQAASSGEATQRLLDVGTPLIEVPKNASPAEKQAAAELAKIQNAEVDGVSTPEFGGYSPGSGGQLKPSTIFGYVLGSLLVIAVFVGIVVVTADCVSGATKA